MRSPRFVLLTLLEKLNGSDQSEQGISSAFPDFFGVKDAREMIDLEMQKKLDLINNAILSVDLETSAHNSRG